MTPQVSPDGKTLAYVRRVRLQSFLYVRDLESGRDRQLFGNIDKDLQEAWAIHGLYPQYAWTPDGKSIVIWGEGKIWRVDVASGKGQPIPFQARVEQTLNARVRVRRTPCTRMSSRSACCATSRVSPDGQLVVYSALGHLYVRALPDRRADAPDAGGARRHGDTYEFFPAFSRDGQWIVYTTWNDTDMGRVRVIKPDGSGGRDVVSHPGHYVEPSFSPDGQIDRLPSRRRRINPRAALSPGTRASTSCPAAGGGALCSPATAGSRSASSITPARASTSAKCATRSTRC